MTFARAQLHLRLLLGHVHARTLPPPELLVAAAHERFDRELQLRHEGTRRVLAATGRTAALLGQYLVHRGDRDRALAHGGSDPLRAAAADIADREHAGNAGFE